MQNTGVVATDGMSPKVRRARTRTHAGPLAAVRSGMSRSCGARGEGTTPELQKPSESAPWCEGMQRAVDAEAIIALSALLRVSAANTMRAGGASGRKVAVSAGIKQGILAY